MFVDRNTDVIILEQPCSGKFVLTRDNDQLMVPESHPQIDNLIRDLNNISCTYYTWVLFPLMLIGVVGAIVVMAVVPYTSVKITLVFVVIIVILMVIPCISFCCASRVNKRKIDVVEAHVPMLQQWYTIGWESVIIVDRWGRQFNRSSGNLLLRRIDLLPTVNIITVAAGYENQPFRPQQPDIPQNPIPIYQFDPEDGEKNIPEGNYNSDIPLPTQENIVVIGGPHIPGAAYQRAPTFGQYNVDSDIPANVPTTNSLASSDVQPYQIPVNRGVSPNKDSQNPNKEI
jgi:hypothetical protein